MRECKWKLRLNLISACVGQCELTLTVYFYIVYLKTSICSRPLESENEKTIPILDNSLTESIQEGKKENFANTSNRKALDKLLLKIIQDIQQKSPKTKLSVPKLGSELKKATGESPNSIIKKLKLGSSFTKYLESSPTFTLKASGKEFEVGISDEQSLLCK